MKKATIVCAVLMLMHSFLFSQTFNNEKIDGYKGVWFSLGQFSEYGDKYSGGLGTYTAKHIPLAIYASQVQKTFFVYGGIVEGKLSNADMPNRKQKDYGNYLVCMVGCFDHKTNTVTKPTVVYDKNGVYDPHDNPSMMLDKDGYIWVFVSGRGRSRMGYIYKSTNPYSIEKFDMIKEAEITYPQPKYDKDKGFLHLFTKYTGVRLLYFNTAIDGTDWTEDQLLAAIKRPEDKNSGHYQISGQHKDKIGFFFNWHPNGDVDRRTNIYYLETPDFGKTWRTVDGQKMEIPITELNNKTLVRDYFSQNRNVYIKDIAYDQKGNPLALYVHGTGHQPGPHNGMKTWSVIYWDGEKWESNDITTSDHNYDTGSLWVSDGKWTVIGPTDNMPQKWGGGGELVMWESSDSGKTWNRKKQITSNSQLNHNYVRKVIDGIDPFLYFWADGNPDKISKSQLYFGDSNGNVWLLPYNMESDSQQPLKVE